MANFMIGLRNLLLKQPLLANFVKPLYYIIPIDWRKHIAIGDHRTTIERHIKPLLCSKSFFVKVGAYDGVTGDPITDIVNQYQ